MTQIKLLLAGLLATIALHAQTGAEIFESKCVSCHVQTPPAGMAGQKGTPAYREAMMKLKAPPMMKVTMRLKDALETKEKFVSFVADYIENPSADKVLCNPRAVKHFGLMPAIGKSMTAEERTKIAEWMYDTFKGQNACKPCTTCTEKGKGQGNGQGKGMKCAAGKCGVN